MLGGQTDNRPTLRRCQLRPVGRTRVDSVAMRILNVTVERVGTSQDGRNLLVGRGRDVVSGWTIGFVIPVGERERILREVRAGRRPMLSVPEADALPFASVSSVAWE